MYFEFHQGKRDAWVPHIDVCERTDEIVILVEVPGASKSDIQVHWNDGVLTIHGEKRAHAVSGVVRHHCVESAHGRFWREIGINVPVDYKRARAELRNGLMRIYLPKKAYEPEAGRIPILE